MTPSASGACEGAVFKGDVENYGLIAEGEIHVDSKSNFRFLIRTQFIS